jgi:hypothetical protein
MFSIVFINLHLPCLDAQTSPVGELGATWQDTSQGHSDPGDPGDPVTAQRK